MLVWLAEHLVKYYSGFNVFSYLTFRAIVSLLTALFISLWMGPRMIAHLQKLSFGQVVRNDGPESHFSKRGTPTMGGIMILTAIVISVLLWAYPSRSEEHTSELQSRFDLVCRLLLEKKNKRRCTNDTRHRCC